MWALDVDWYFVCLDEALSIFAEKGHCPKLCRCCNFVEQ